RWGGGGRAAGRCRPPGAPPPHPPPPHARAAAAAAPRLRFHQDGDCGDTYAFALDAAGPDGEHPVVRRDPFTGDEEPFADSFAGFLTVRTALLGGLREGPNPTVARLWRATPGVALPGGATVYGPRALRARNDAHEVAARAPHWVLVGDDGAGRGLFMRRHGRDRTAVHRLGLDAFRTVDGDIGAVGEHLVRLAVPEESVHAPAGAA
ncbi:hypothetical protein, partial [Streptomyces sp. NPDC058953]|uniref:hypothetical protein n=1 Tax=Streptomyces sp. NPDC058953 TaxID=3346676 RepID=UPI0036CC1D1B